MLKFYCCVCLMYMNPSLKLVFIKREFEKENYELLTKVYLNSHQLLDFICNKGHQHKISWASFQQGQRCFYCSNKSLNFEDIQQAFKDRNYLLVTKKEQYKNNQQLLDFICPNGHQHKISWASFQKGCHCFYCYGKAVNFETIQQTFKNKNYLLTTTKEQYKNSHQLLDFICPNGHQHKISWAKFQQGQRCGKCFEESLNECRLFTPAIIYNRTKKHSKLPKDFLKNLCADLATEDLKKFYFDTPKGCHVDHVVPVSFFNLNYIEEIEACWSIHNLRYLLATYNMRRSNNMTRGEILALNPEQKSIFNIASNVPEELQNFQD